MTEMWVVRRVIRRVRDGGLLQTGTLLAAVCAAVLTALLLATCGADIVAAGEPQHAEECSVQAAASTGTPTTAAPLAVAIPSRVGAIPTAPGRWHPDHMRQVGEPRAPVVDPQHLRSPPRSAIV